MVFGIDGGGTRSRLQVVSEQTGRTVCRVEGNSTNIYSVGLDSVKENLTDLLLKGCQKAGIDPHDLQAGCIGSAGLDRPSERACFKEILSDLVKPTCVLTLCNDGEILLVGGTGAYEGYCIIAGTGSLALGRGYPQKMVRSGGLGYLLGDEGSAVWITYQAVVRSLRSREGRDMETTLLTGLLDYFKLDSPYGFIDMMHHHFNKALFAGASPLVTDYALKGDGLAQDILEMASHELVSLVRSVCTQLPLRKKILVASGGVLEHDPIVRPRFAQLLVEELPEVMLMKSVGTAVDGACMIALDSLEIKGIPHQLADFQ